MQINAISFGKKIPKIKAEVYNKTTKQNEPVTMYEYDCSEAKDVDTIHALNRDWIYKQVIYNGMQRKYNKQTSPVNTKKYSYYSLEKDNGEIIGITEVENNINKKSVHFIESKPTKEYKYTGQVMLSSLARLIIDGHENKLVIMNPVYSARDFYKDTCGFTPYKSSIRDLAEGSHELELEMNRSQLRNFIKQTEERTNHPIINLKA